MNHWKRKGGGEEGRKEGREEERKRGREEERKRGREEERKEGKKAGIQEGPGRRPGRQAAGQESEKEWFSCNLLIRRCESERHFGVTPDWDGSRARRHHAGESLQKQNKWIIVLRVGPKSNIVRVFITLYSLYCVPYSLYCIHYILHRSISTIDESWLNRQMNTTGITCPVARNANAIFPDKLI